jgi:hypothetical protein
VKLPYPRNAHPIVEARARGLKPAGPLLVVATSQYQRLPDDAHVFVEPERLYRWDWVRGLDNIVVLVDASTKLGSLLVDLEEAHVGQIDVVDVERRLGWMVGFAQPLCTIRWPAVLVEDWLGHGGWHTGLARDKAEGDARAAEKWRYTP